MAVVCAAAAFLAVYWPAFVSEEGMEKAQWMFGLWIAASAAVAFLRVVLAGQVYAFDGISLLAVSLTAMGILGCIGYFGMFLCCMKKSVEGMQKNGNAAALMGMAVVAAYLVQGIPALAETVGQWAANAYAADGREMPSNPVHHCTKKNDGTDTTDWSYVWFGSYPQTEVTGNALTAAITGASYDSNGDAWVDGIKYRRVSKSDANNTSYFGSSEYRYFKWERIKWRVLQNNGSTLFVVVDKGLDCKDYNEQYTSITWENCTLRKWLNNDFYSTAFSGGEQGAIVEQTVVNEDNPDYGIEGGNDTRDKVFLLFIGEVSSPDYGFCESDGTYSASRWIEASDYAHAMGAFAFTYVGNSWCWLR